ncbi:response regulator transcription factor [Streptomyces gobiensis]|uniref:response regulator transcription factor n=1 Tax=Streptomyces gobiensis TaxID=2875706 RepID=UPI001E3007DC|nr:DNA-binding response regulator [Streptomyces gobiensis]UGY90950.1 DNA-binding response regulator [Streptomyces gobiensis]
MHRVLVVEHHPQVLDALADLVAEEPGFELAGVAGTAREAISLARHLNPDVVLIDVDKPEWKTDRLDHSLAELLPEAVFIRLSALADNAEKDCLKSPASTLRSVPKTAIPDLLRSFAE